MKPTRSTGPKLGELLEARGRLDRESLFRAMRHQRAAGGRIGTCLLELELVAEDELLHLLSEQAKLPFVEAEALRSVPDDTIRLVPAKVARSRRAIPFRASGSQLYVAMIDPHDIAAQDELSFVSGRRVRPQVASEVRILEALARYYQVDIPTRFVKLLDKMNRARYLWREGAAQPEAGAAPGRETRPIPGVAVVAPAPRPPEPPAEGTARSETPSAASVPPPGADPEAAPAAPAPPPPEPIAPGSPPSPPADAALSLEQAEARLLEPAHRDEVARTLVEFARGRSEAALLLVVRRDEAAGWLAAIPGRGEEAWRSFRLRMNEPSMLLALREGVPYYRGPLPPLRAHDGLAALLGDSGRAEILALPLHVRQRLVGVLVTAARGYAPATVDQFRRVTSKASVALEMLVLRQKLQHT
jgi:hypothetical protein